jgi:hypothetical protein
MVSDFKRRWHISTTPNTTKKICTLFKLAFPRDGTSRCPFVPRQRNFLVPVSLCPGTRAVAKIPGQTPLSRDKITFPKEQKKQEKDVPKQEKNVPKQKKTF